mgnify:CR=1 FL=1
MPYCAIPVLPPDRVMLVRYFWLLGLLVANLPLGAMYISDKQVVAMYSTAGLQGPPIAYLDAGVELERLDDNEQAIKVRYDKTVGWIAADRLTEHMPAAMRLSQVQMELEQAQARLARLEQSQAELLAARMAQLKLERLQQRTARAVEMLGGQMPVPDRAQKTAAWVDWIPWLSGLMGGSLGLVVGVLLLNYRVRRRYGGLRVL